MKKEAYLNHLRERGYAILPDETRVSLQDTIYLICSEEHWKYGTVFFLVRA